MGFIKTVDEYKRKFGSVPVDMDGTPIQPGDQVIIEHDTGYQGEFFTGQSGVVRGWHNTERGYHAVQLDTPNDHCSDCDGLVPTGSGRWERFDNVRKGGAILADEDIDTHVKRITDEIKAESTLSIQGGKVYNVTLAEKPELTDALDKVLSICANKIREANRQVSTARKQAKDEIARLFPFPNLTIDHIRNGLRVFKEAGYICYVAPFNFAPKFLGRGRSVPTYTLSKTHQTKLATDLFFKIIVNKSGAIVGTTLFADADLSKMFYHYHGDGYDCLGSVEKTVINSPNDALTFRDKYQSALTIVNIGSLVSRSCRGLTVSELKHRAKPIKEGETWTTTGIPKQPPRPLVIGDRVRLTGLYDALRSSDIGIEGRIIREESDGNSNVCVEFDNELHCGHDGGRLGKGGYCYNIPPDCLELLTPPPLTPPAPSATPAPAPSTTPPATGWTTTIEVPIGGTTVTAEVLETTEAPEEDEEEDD